MRGICLSRRAKGQRNCQNGSRNKQPSRGLQSTPAKTVGEGAELPGWNIYAVLFPSWLLLECDCGG